jgi:hypothetical protein
MAYNAPYRVPSLLRHPMPHDFHRDKTLDKIIKHARDLAVLDKKAILYGDLPLRVRGEKSSIHGKTETRKPGVCSRKNEE